MTVHQSLASWQLPTAERDRMLIKVVLRSERLASGTGR
jgi:hypothetical protein